MVALVGMYLGYLALAFLPPLLWLFFFLHEDRHPEPKHLLLATFVAGIVSAFVAFVAEFALFSEPLVDFAGKVMFGGGILYRLFPATFGSCDFSSAAILAGGLAGCAILFLGIAFVEEYVKYFAVKLVALSRVEFDEPVDAMIYMVTAGLGFAAIENAFFIFSGLPDLGANGSVYLAANRFMGANLLHGLASGLVGYALARHVFSPWRRHALASGIAFATVLHALFNYLIIKKSVEAIRIELYAAATPFYQTPLFWLLLVGALLVFMGIAVLAEFERLRRRNDRRMNPVTAQPSGSDYR
ncbi:PrsW family intramembrane metalloprotease [Candidatus Parcubacteria bacterium]|nr:MAG: PrsW family intramembrane metalloprotease [Candidatus Parcubacteria bacterium]